MDNKKDNSKLNDEKMDAKIDSKDAEKMEKIVETVAKVVEKEVEKTPEEIALLRVAELTTLLQHLQADFQNYRKRMEKDRQDLIKYSTKNVLSKLIPVLDNFQLALNNANPGKEFVKGVEMIYSQFLSTLESEGLKPIPAKKGKFDPEIHEAISHVHSDDEAGTVIEEFQQGYTLNNKVIRHSRVKVSAGPKKK